MLSETLDYECMVSATSHTEAAIEVLCRLGSGSVDGFEPQGEIGVDAATNVLRLLGGGYADGVWVEPQGENCSVMSFVCMSVLYRRSGEVFVRKVSYRIADTIASESEVAS